jgi:hypothetical protein
MINAVVMGSFAMIYIQGSIMFESDVQKLFGAGELINTLSLSLVRAQQDDIHRDTCCGRDIWKQCSPIWQHWIIV